MKIKEILEARNRMFEYIKNVLPTWPDYVLKDLVYTNLARDVQTSGPDRFGKDNIIEFITNMGLTPNSKWTLISNFEFKMDILTPDTQKRLRERAGGSLNPYQVPNDAERHAKQSELAKKQGGISKEPVILAKHNNGYELLEGWHRTIQHFKEFPGGYRGPAWIAVATNLEENFADGKINESAYEEAWELISQPVPEIQQFVQQLGLSKDDAKAKMKQQ